VTSSGLPKLLYWLLAAVPLATYVVCVCLLLRGTSQKRSSHWWWRP
jgi:hypothetical protein